MNRQISLLSLPCALCGADTISGQSLCAGCFQGLPFSTSEVCSVCAVPVKVSGRLCGRCINELPVYKKCISTFIYQEPITTLIQALKFHDKLAYAALLGNMMAEFICDQLDEVPEIIIPVPLHRSRLCERGYNQALELSRPISRKLGVSIDYACCQRHRPTEVQSLLPEKDRNRNVKGAFSFDNKNRYTHAAIVDDVMTTSHTVNELSLTLLRAGVVCVQVWVCARAVLK